MIIKKAIHSWRNRIVTFVQLALPVIFTILALVIESNATEFAEEPSLNLDLAKFENPVTIYTNPSNLIAAKYKDLFQTTEDASSTSFDRYVINKMSEVMNNSISISFYLYPSISRLFKYFGEFLVVEGFRQICLIFIVTNRIIILSFLGRDDHLQQEVHCWFTR